MNRKNKKYTKEEIEEAVKKSLNYSDVFRNLGLKINGGSYQWIKKTIKRHDINISHFGPVNTRFMEAGQKAVRERIITLFDVANISNGERRACKILQSFLEFKKVPYRCNDCGLSEWKNRPIRLDIDHKDGKCENNHIDNLQYLCPNCHRQKTIKFTGIIEKPKKTIKIKKIIEKRIKCPPNACSCGKKILHTSIKCKACAASIKTTQLYCKNWPDDAELQQLVWEYSLVKLGIKLGMTDNAIKKRCKKRDIILPPKNYWSLFQFKKFDECKKIKSEYFDKLKIPEF